MAASESASVDLRAQRLARVIDREVAPIWQDRFARLIFRHVNPRANLVALDVHCGAGRTTTELLRRLPDSSRVLALDDDAANLTLAKARIRSDWHERVYFKAGDFDDVAATSDATYDLTLANIVLTEKVLQWEVGLGELLRVTKPKGQVLASIPLEGTWAEAEDLLGEVLRDANLPQAVKTLERFRRRRPSSRDLALALERTGLTPDDYFIEQERFQLLFRSGREFLFSPIIEHGPLALWKAIIGDAKDAQKLFWRFKEAIDTYYAGRVFTVTAVAGVVVARPPAEDGAAAGFANEYWRRYPNVAALWGINSGPGDTGDDELEIDIALEEDTPAPEEDDDDLEELFEGAFDLSSVTSPSNLDSGPEWDDPGTDPGDTTSGSAAGGMFSSSDDPLKDPESSQSGLLPHPTPQPVSDSDASVEIDFEPSTAPAADDDADDSVEIDLGPSAIPTPDDDDSDSMEIDLDLDRSTGEPESVARRYMGTRETRMVQAVAPSETPPKRRKKRGRLGRRKAKRSKPRS